MTPAIETYELTRYFGRVVALDHLDLEIPAGCTYALLGPNGAGKSTALRLILDLLHPSSGFATVLGTPSYRLRGAPMREIGYLAADQELPRWMKAGAFLDWCRPLYPSWDETLAERLVRRFELPLERKIKHLSRGMEMKLRLVSSLAFRPRLLILDEPFAGLDVVARDEFIEGVLELAGSDDWTVVLASHELDETERIAERVGFLDRGRLLLDEDAETLRERFRRVEVVLPEAAEMPSPWPSAWLRPEASGRVLRFIDGEHGSASRARLAELFPDAVETHARPMSLRELFSALTLSHAAFELEAAGRS